MAGSGNKVILIGNLGKDPEVRSMQNGGKVCNLSVATSESWKDKMSGERKERTEWHRVVIFNENLISVAERFLKKGSKVYLEGQIETRKWSDQAGVEKYSTEVVLRPFRGELTLLDGREGGGLGVLQLQTGNALQVSKQVRATLDRLSKSFPAGMTYHVAFDTTEFVSESIREVVITLLIAIALVVLVIFLFLQDWRTTLIPALTIPISLIGTFFLMNVLGFSINQLGLVVDDAIVVIENISRFVQ